MFSIFYIHHLCAVERFSFSLSLTLFIPFFLLVFQKQQMFHFLNILSSASVCKWLLAVLNMYVCTCVYVCTHSYTCARFFFYSKRNKRKINKLIDLNWQCTARPLHSEIALHIQKKNQKICILTIFHFFFLLLTHIYICIVGCFLPKFRFKYVKQQRQQWTGIKYGGESKNS